MWPFKGKPFDLIDDKWLRDNGIDEEFADAFNRSKGELKKDVRRTQEKLNEITASVDSLDTRIRDRELEKKKLKRTQDGLKKGDDAKHSQELQRVKAEIEGLVSTIDQLGQRQLKEKVRIDNLQNTIRVLQQIQIRTILTAKELTSKPMTSSVAGLVDEWRDELPRESDIDNSDILEEDSDDQEKDSNDKIDPKI